MSPDSILDDYFQHIDCAYIYLNESEIGAALGKVIGSVVKREELFIVGKLWNHSHQPDQVEERIFSCPKSNTQSNFLFLSRIFKMKFKIRIKGCMRPNNEGTRS